MRVLKVVSLLAGLALMLFLGPSILDGQRAMRSSTALLKQANEGLAERAVPAPPMVAVQVPAPVRPMPVPSPAEPPKADNTPTPVVEAPPTAQYIAPADASDLSSMNGWVDQPDKAKPGRMHTNLRVQWASKNTVRRPATYGDCWKTVTRPPERLTIPGGTVDVLAPRRITVPCSQ